MNGQRLSIADVGQVGHELQAVNNARASRAAALDTDAQHTAEAALEVLLGRRVRRVRLQARVRDPSDIGALLEPVGQSQRVLGVPLSAQRQRLQAEQQLLRTEGVETGAEVAQELDAHADGVGDRAEGLPKLEAVVALGRLDHLRELVAVLAPVELAAVDNDTGDGGAVAADPLGRGVHDDVGAVLDWAHKVAARTEGVIDLVVVSDLGLH